MTGIRPTRRCLQQRRQLGVPPGRLFILRGSPLYASSIHPWINEGNYLKSVRPVKAE